MKNFSVGIILAALMSVAVSAYSEEVKEVTLNSSVETAESQLKMMVSKKEAEVSVLTQEIEIQKKTLADANTANADKDLTISALRTQAAESATKLAAIQASAEAEVLSLLSENVSNVKLRDFGSVRLIPLLNDYLVIIPPELSQKVDFFFSKIQKRVLVGKTGIYLICDRKYFVPATAASHPDVNKMGDKL